MTTLEEAIASYEKSAERYHKSFLHCKAHGGEFYQEEAESNKICYEHDHQLATWLRELQEKRKQPKIIHCCECSSYGKSLSGKYMCLAHCTYPQPNHYCADGIRRTDG